MMIFSLSFLIALCSLVLRADEFQQTRFRNLGETVQFIGYVKTDIFADTRLGFEERDGHSYIIPFRRYSPCNGDIFKHGEFNILSIESNFGFKVKGKPILGAKENYAVIVGDFWGTRDIAINNYRMRYGYMNFIWEKRDLLVGQIEQALYIPECTTGVIAYNNGDPFEPQIWSPQVRYTERALPVQLMVAACAQVMDPSTGPIGDSTTYIRHALMPNFTVDLRYIDDRDFLIGAAVDLKRLVPRLVNDQLCRVNESVFGTSAQFYGAGTVHNVHIASKMIYVENLYEFGILGGYAVRSQNAQGCRTYSPLREFVWWWDIARREGRILPGVFAGFIYNLGAAHRLFIDPASQPITYALAPDARYAFKICPRLRWVENQVTWAVEIEYAQAQYGTMDEYARVHKTQSPVHNIRFCVAAYYYF